jgi:hypothetical protein
LRLEAAMAMAVAVALRKPSPMVEADAQKTAAQVVGLETPRAGVAESTTLNCHCPP